MKILCLACAELSRVRVDAASALCGIMMGYPRFSLTAAVAARSPEFRTLPGLERRMSNNAITQELVREVRWWLISRSME